MKNSTHLFTFLLITCIVVLSYHPLFANTSPIVETGENQTLVLFNNEADLVGISEWASGTYFLEVKRLLKW